MHFIAYICNNSSSSVKMQVIFEDIFEGKVNMNCEAENTVYKNVVISDLQDVPFCHSVINYYKVKSS